MKNFAGVLLAILFFGCSEDNVLSPADQLKKDIETIDKYLAKNGITATEDESGLRIVVETTGNSSYPSGTSILTVNYTGKFLNGKVFDQSVPNNLGVPSPLATPLSGLIEGWRIVFTKYVAKGGKATFYLPSGLAYKQTGFKSIPPNTNVIFEVELIGFTN